MPHTVKLAQAYGENLNIILIECQNAGDEKVEKMAYNMTWMGTPAMWTSERPFSTGSRSVPSFALLSNEGEVLMKGNPLDSAKQIEEMITALEQELAGMKERFGDEMIYKNPHQLTQLQRSFDAKTAELSLLYRAYDRRAG